MSWSSSSCLRRMKNHSIFLSLVLLLNLVASSAQKQVYIIYLGEHSGKRSWQEIEEIHHSYLASVKGSREEAEACIIYSYKNVINGFSALLTSEESHTISEMEGVISVFRSRSSQLHTTRSWDFISLLEANWDASKANGEELLARAGYGKDVVVGVLDSGVWPESQSFNDEGMEAIPPSWNGFCETGDDFNSSHCNRKLVGARFYLKGYEARYGTLDPRVNTRSPRDNHGHGTHTASTVGGRRVRNPISGIGKGTASGGAPLVRLAIYKVCWLIPRKIPAKTACLDDDMLAAFDDAIADGVDVISVSIGAMAWLYFMESIAIGALHAERKKIVVACSAGNAGPGASTVMNAVPWIITVAASSIDRVFSSPLRLGNGVVLKAQSITPNQRATHPLVYAKDAESPDMDTLNLPRGLCVAGSLLPSFVQGKTVLCDEVGDTVGISSLGQALEVQNAGGSAVVLVDRIIGVLEGQYMIPAMVVQPDEDADAIYNYSVTSKAPVATLNPPTVLLGTKPAPIMAAFSSRGPNLNQPNLLKPDITAPGLHILAAWSEAASPLNVPIDDRIVKYKIYSGTSMSCPHVAAVAALLKAIHPDWSSAAIRSALITSAKVTNNQGKAITDAQGNLATPFEFGAGHIQPSMAADPGLVYDATYEDYLLFLCSRGSTQFFDRSFICPDDQDVPHPSNLNYPSLAIAPLYNALTVERTVTNVGPAKSSYTVTINQPKGYTVEITPMALSFSASGEKKSFKIRVKVESSAVKNEYAFGSFVWSDGNHQVTSPIAVCTS